jgi:hypothetical protein
LPQSREPRVAERGEERTVPRSGIKALFHVEQISRTVGADRAQRPHRLHEYNVQGDRRELQV